MTKIIYGVLDNTGKCPFYTDFFEKKENALKELEKQMDYAHIEFGMEDLKLVGEKVYQNNKVIFSVDKFTLK